MLISIFWHVRVAYLLNLVISVCVETAILESVLYL